MLVILFNSASIRADEGAEEATACVLAPAEQVFAELLVNHPEQVRETLECDPHLMDFARSRAMDMAKRRYFGHVTPDRQGPNELLRASGYEMPAYYVGGIANSVESILGGVEDPHVAWKHLLDSSSHRNHLLGLNDMYAIQSRFGIAHVHEPESDYAHYWVVVLVEPGREERPMTCTPPPSICIVH